MRLLMPILLLVPLVLAEEGETDPFRNQPRGTFEMRRKAHIAHGIIISLAAVILFPIGGILLRWFKTSPRAIRFHLVFQLLSLFILLLGFCLGAWLAYLENKTFRQFHQHVGLLIIGLYCLMPLVGIFAHPHFQYRSATGRASSWANIFHVYIGRFLLVAGILNGILGIKVASNSGFQWPGQYVVYYLFIGIIVLAYGSMLFVWCVGRHREIRENGIQRRDTELREMEGRF